MHISRAYKPQHIRQVRSLLYAYGISRNLDEALGNYFEELSMLPQKYGPPQGCLLLAMDDKQPLGCVAFRPEREYICEKTLCQAPSPRSAGRKGTLYAPDEDRTTKRVW